LIEEQLHHVLWCLGFGRITMWLDSSEF